MENAKTPKRHNHGPNKEIEKPKDFKSAMKRLFKELKSFKVAIYISLFLAAVGSMISIYTPDILSDLTDEISKGLVLDTTNLEKINNNVKEQLEEEKISIKIKEILNINLTKEKAFEINNSSLTQSQKEEFNNTLSELSKTPSNISLLSNLDEETLSYIVEDTTYNNVTITKNEKISLLKTIDSENKNLSENILKVLLEDIKVDNITITKEELATFISEISKVKKDDTHTIYQKIDETSSSLKSLLEPKMDIKKITNITIFLIILYIISASFTYIESILMTNVSNKFAKKLRSKISKKINLLPLKYFDNHVTGDILSRVTNDVDTIAQSMNQSLSTLVSALTLFIGSIIMMFVTNWIMALTAISASLVGFVFMSLVLSKSQKYFTARQKELGKLDGHIEEIYSGLNVVKVYNGKKQSDLEFDRLNKNLFDANRKSQFLSGLMFPMMSFIGNFGYVAVCIVGALLTINGTISFGVIVAFIMYVRLFTSPLSQIAQAMTSMQSTAASSERVFEFLDEEEMSDQKEITKMLTNKEARGKIEFKDVTFTYPGNEKPTIKHFNATVKPGEKIAIVGPTGAGKTTMVNLLMKFYDIKQGDILIDGISIKELSRENIHNLFTMVLQDTWVFNGSVKENVIYNRENINDEKVKEVCKYIGLDHFIKTLPKGYETELKDNDSVSSGQRQLLTIARGMLEDAPFLILDEATSNVDTRTEELVSKAMDKLMNGRTSFIIAHRLSTIKNADLILVMKDGNIIEQGNHEQLIKQNGFYAELYNSQFEL